MVIGPADLTLKEGTNTIVYAWGSGADKNLKLAVQTISGLHCNPGGVPAGTGGQARRATDLPLPLVRLDRARRRGRWSRRCAVARRGRPG